MSQIDSQPNPFISAVPVEIQDQHSEVIDLYMCSDVLTTNPTAPIVVDAKSINLASVTGAATGDCMDISENGHTFQAIITNITLLVVTFSAPSDYAFTTAAVVKTGKWNMNVDGSITSKIFNIMPPTGVQWDINRIVIGITDDAAMDDGKFGGITALPNGIILRIKDGYNKNLFQVSDNSGFRERSFDIVYADKAPAGTYGFGCKKTFNGQDGHGVALRLNGDTQDELQLIVQDNLTALTKMAVVAQGHTVVS